jgi:type II secretory pathway component PulK
LGEDEVNRRGIVLVVVLWALLLLGTIALSFAYAMRTEARAARNYADTVRAYYGARTGIERAVMMFATLPMDNVLSAPIAAEEGDAGYRVAVESESGKIDVNLATGERIRSVLAASGVPDGEATALSDAIVSWRGGETEAGPTEGEYAALPEPIRPRKGKMLSVEELRYVKGVSRDLYEKLLSRIFTVHGGSPQVNVNAASPVVLRALGLTGEQVDRLIESRKEAPFRTEPELVVGLARAGIPPAVLASLTTASTSNVYTVTARGTAGGDAVRIIRCRVKVEGAGPRGVRIGRWEDLVPAGEEAK